MRWLPLLLITVILCAPALALDKLTGFVNDEAGVISPEYEQLLNDELYNLKLNTSVEMAVATVKSLGGVPIGEYSLKLAHEVLGDKEKDNGLLVLLAVDDREYRIEVGYGLEGIIPDLLASRIGRNIMEPSFKAGDYGKGLYDGVVVISAILRNDTSKETEVTTQLLNEQIKQNAMVIAIFVLVVLAMMIPIFIIAYKNAKKKAKKEGKEGDNDFLAAIILASMFGKGGRGGSGGFGGGSSGGFGGFGGGGFGGGGFSGKF